MGISVMKMCICLSAPLILMIILTEGETRRHIFFLILGFLSCSVADAVNSYIIDNMAHYNTKIFAAYYAPVVEELLKMVPVLVYMIIMRKKKKDSFIVGMTVGVGFAILENVYYMITNAAKISSLQWIFARGFATALMHGLCTAVVAYTLNVAYRHKKMYITGTIAALAMAMTYHSIYNIMVQTEYRDMILLMPITTYALIFIVRKRTAISNGLERIRNNRNR